MDCIQCINTLYVNIHDPIVTSSILILNKRMTGLRNNKTYMLDILWLLSMNAFELIVHILHMVTSLNETFSSLNFCFIS